MDHAIVKVACDRQVGENRLEIVTKFKEFFIVKVSLCISTIRHECNMQNKEVEANKQGFKQEERPESMYSLEATKRGKSKDRLMETPTDVTRLLAEA